MIKKANNLPTDGSLLDSDSEAEDELDSFPNEYITYYK